MLQDPKPIGPPEKCPKCGSTNLIEDDGLKCQDCDWEDENPEDFENDAE